MSDSQVGDRLYDDDGVWELREDGWWELQSETNERINVRTIKKYEDSLPEISPLTNMISGTEYIKNEDAAIAEIGLAPKVVGWNELSFFIRFLFYCNAIAICFLALHFLL